MARTRERERGYPSKYTWIMFHCEHQGKTAGERQIERDHKWIGEGGHSEERVGGGGEAK